MGNAFRESRPLTREERSRIEVLCKKNHRRLVFARCGFYSELVLLMSSLVLSRLGFSAWHSVLAIATMPGVIGLVIAGASLRPLAQLVRSLKQDLENGAIEIYGDDDVVRLPHSGLALCIYGNDIEPGSAFPIAVGVPRSQDDVYPARLEWSPARRKFAMCRQLSCAELEELRQLRRRMSTRYLLPAIAYFAFGGLALWVLSHSSAMSDHLVPVSVLITGAWFLWRVLLDLFVAARLGTEHAVVSDSINDGRRTLPIEVLPAASLVWTVDRTPAHWRF